MPLDILFQDTHFVAVNKPSGVFVHKNRRGESGRFALQMVRDQVGCRVYPAHRLDRSTSGVLLFALDPHSAARINTAFQNREVEKTYLAVVRGWVEAEGAIDYPLKHLPAGDGETPAPTQVVKLACSRYRRLGAVEIPYAVSRYPTSRYSLVAVFPETGRFHQIRRHFSHISHPIVGDTTYGDSRHNRFVRGHFGVGRLLLAATELSFNHPFKDLRVTIAAPLDPAFFHLVAKLGWEEQVPPAWRP